MHLVIYCVYKTEHSKRQNNNNNKIKLNKEINSNIKLNQQIVWSEVFCDSNLKCKSHTQFTGNKINTHLTYDTT